MQTAREERKEIRRQLQEQLGGDRAAIDRIAPKLDLPYVGNTYDQDDPYTTNLFLSNLSQDVVEADIIQVFGRFGPLASVKVMYPRNDEERLRGFLCGFVAFMVRVDADRAFIGLEGRGELVKSPMMRMSWAKGVNIPPNLFIGKPEKMDLPSLSPRRSVIRAGAAVEKLAHFLGPYALASRLRDLRLRIKDLEAQVVLRGVEKLALGPAGEEAVVGDVSEAGWPDKLKALVEDDPDIPAKLYVSQLLPSVDRVLIDALFEKENIRELTLTPASRWSKTGILTMISEQAAIDAREEYDGFVVDDGEVSRAMRIFPYADYLKSLHTGQKLIQDPDLPPVKTAAAAAKEPKEPKGAGAHNKHYSDEETDDMDTEDRFFDALENI